MNYDEARRQARSMLGMKAEVEFAKGKAFPYRVMVVVEGKRVYVGLSNHGFFEALQDARERQVDS